MWYDIYVIFYTILINRESSLLLFQVSIAMLLLFSRGFFYCKKSVPMFYFTADCGERWLFMDTQLKIQENPANILTVTPKEFTKLKACRKSFMFGRIGLRYDGYEGVQFERSVVERVKEILANGGDVSAEVHDLYDGYKKEWFSCDKEWESSRSNSMKRVTRLAEYVKHMDRKLVEINVKYSSKFVSSFTYRGYKIQAIAGKFDFVFDKNGHKTYVILHYGTPTESTRARKKENLPENSPEILAATLAAREQFGDRDFHVELWYIRNKDDNGTQVVDRFEHRPGKNIVSVNFSSVDGEKLSIRLAESLSGQEKCKCENCRHCCICKKETQIRKTRQSVVKADATGQKLDLTEAQLKVVNHVNGPMCVVAVPGAGKTASLVERLVHLIRDVHVKPQKILFVTFTKKAAREITERVERQLLLAGIKGMPQIKTYNALGFSILKENPLYVGKRIKLAEDIDRYTLIFKALKEQKDIENMSYINPLGEHGIVKFLDLKFDEIEAHGKDSFRIQYKERYDVEGMIRVYDAYKAKYENAGFISYDDQISMVNELFDEYSVLPQRYSQKYEFVMVDEFQDSSEEQVEMIYAIAHCHNNLVVVGDDDQGIYKWRGGSSKYMLEFQYDFPSAEMVYMEDNFRSSEEILNLCNALIQGNGTRYAKKLVSHIKGEHKPLYLKDVDPLVLQNVVKAAMKNGCKPGEIAVLARSNKRLDEVMTILDGVCPVSIPKDYLIEDAVFTCIYDVMTLFYKGLSSDVALYRFLKVFGLAENIVKDEKDKSLYENLILSGNISKIELTPECLNRMATEKKELNKAFYVLLTCFEKLKYGQLRETLLFIIKECLGLDEHLVVEDLVDMAEDKGIVNLSSMYEVMEDMILFNSTERVGYDTAEDAVNLLTAHDSKGKEFRAVIIYCMEDFEMTEEEIRVLYVAMSRAKKYLYMIESAYNRFDGFNRIAPYVQVQGTN